MIGNWKYLTEPNITQLNEIYVKYCKYKKFKSVMPIFDVQYRNPLVDILGYYDTSNILVAFSLIMKYDAVNAECLQFAWDYSNPKLNLGIASLKNECAIYKDRGFKYLYLGLADKYKTSIDGFELVGPNYGI